jgi:hypothetical protein
MDPDDFDVDELEGAEYDESNAPYRGPQPPRDTELTGIIKKAWWTESSDGDRMMKVIFEGDEDCKKYKGIGIWDNITFNAKSKWRWLPFLEATGLTLKDIQTKMYVESEDDNVGAPIQKIGKWVPGEKSTAVRVITDRKPYNGEMSTKIGTWLSYEDEYDEDDEDEEEEEAPPPRAKKAASSKTKTRRAPDPEPDEDVEDEDEEMSDEDAAELEEEDEDTDDDIDEQAARRPAKRRTAATPTASRPRAARPAPSVSARRSADSGKVASKPTRPRRAAPKDADDDPPFLQSQSGKSC